jgi:hypothetical protein
MEGTDQETTAAAAALKPFVTTEQQGAELPNGRVGQGPRLRLGFRPALVWPNTAPGGVNDATAARKYMYWALACQSSFFPTNILHDPSRLVYSFSLTAHSNVAYHYDKPNLSSLCACGPCPHFASINKRATHSGAHYVITPSDGRKPRSATSWWLLPSSSE